SSTLRLRIVFSFLLILPPPPTSPLFPYTTLFRSLELGPQRLALDEGHGVIQQPIRGASAEQRNDVRMLELRGELDFAPEALDARDRKSTRLNSSHVSISYAVFCLKKKNKNRIQRH